MVSQPNKLFCKSVADPGFPRGGGANSSGGCQHTILPNLPENCMKLKEFGPRGACVPHAPLTSASSTFNHVVFPQYITIYFLILEGFVCVKLLKLSRQITDVSNLSSLGINGLEMEASDVQILIHNDKNDISSAAFNLLTEWAKTQTDKITAWKIMQETLQRTDMTAYIAKI